MTMETTLTNRAERILTNKVNLDIIIMAVKAHWITNIKPPMVKHIGHDKEITELLRELEAQQTELK